MNRRHWLALALALILLLPCASHAQEARQFPLDFSYLRYFAPNAIGWLYQPDTTLNQPVLLTDDRTQYLTDGFDGRSTRTGSIYMLREDGTSLSAPAITLRGKNCSDNSLFGSLSEYREPEYYAAHPTLYLISPEGSYRLDIFAGVRGSHADKVSWNPAAPGVMTDAFLNDVLENSFLTPNPDFLPQEGDAWATLATESAERKGSRFVLYARKRPLAPDEIPTVYMNLYGAPEQATVSGYATDPDGKEWLIYGQEDPLWRRFTFESPSSSKNRPFGDGGCGPTSIAIAIANLVPTEQLPRIAQYASNPDGYVFCTCCISNRRCSGLHAPYRLQTTEDYLRYFPIAVGDFATGNNTFGVRGRSTGYGTSMIYLEQICSVYDISVTPAADVHEAIAFLKQENAIAISCVSGAHTPFTNTSHFLVLAKADDEYLYVLDPLRRETYGKMDRYKVTEVLSPGLVRVKLQDVDTCHFNTIKLLKYEP